MIYLKEHFDLDPASPATRDRFVERAEKALEPANAEHGAGLIGAWFCHDEWFSRIVHVTAFPGLGAFEAWRRDDRLADTRATLDGLAPERRSELLEPLGPVAPAALGAGIEASRDEPAGVYSLAILEVRPGQLDRFAALLGAAAPSLPILACWREVVGHPGRILDLWKGDIGRHPYRPTDAGQDAFFGPLREVAPRERLVRLHPLPYSPLR